MNNKRSLWKGECLGLLFWGVRLLLASFTLGLPAHTSFAQNDNTPRKTLEVAREYLKRGDFAKAAETYKQIAKEATLVNQVWPGYLEALKQTKQTEEAERYLKRLAKATHRPDFWARLSLLYQEEKKDKESLKAKTEAFESCRAQDQARQLSLLYEGENKLPDAIEALLLARKLAGGGLTYAYDIGQLYARNGQTDKMLDELFALADQDPATLMEVQGMLQNSLEKKDQVDVFEGRLLAKVQADPSNTTFVNLLYWLYIQQKDFDGAFLQAKGLDRRAAERGAYPVHLLEVAQLARSADAFDKAAGVYEYIVQAYPNSAAAFSARREGLEMKREQLEGSYPVNKDLARKLVRAYVSLLGTAAPQEQGGIYYELGRLQGFYLGKLDSAGVLFEKAIAAARYSPDLGAKAKLQLGDLYLLKGEAWESTLLYSQVEKDFKEQPIGHQAKLRNARLSFFKGDFKLSEEHLGVLKHATSREIANDALQLGLMISDNLVKDSTGAALRVFARAELLLLRTQYDDAVRTLDSIPVKYKGDDLEDDVLHRKAEVFAQTRRYPEAIENYKRLVDVFPESIYADEALFEQARLIEEKLGDKPTAMGLYERLLKEMPGSVYVAEARKRFRALRGDGV